MEGTLVSLLPSQPKEGPGVVCLSGSHQERAGWIKAPPLVCRY